MSENLEVSSSSPQVDLLQLAGHLLRSKRLLVIYMAAGITLGLVLSLLWPASYTATTEILPPSQRPSNASVMLSEMSAGTAALASAGTEFQARGMAEMYVHMVQAEPVLDGVIDQFRLKDVYRKRYAEDARKSLLGHSSIAASKEGFVSITVRDHDATRAADIANGYVTHLRNLSHHLALTDSSQRRIFYEAQLARTKEELARSEIAFKKMQQSNRVISLDAQAKTLIEGAARLRAEIATKEVELERLRGFATGNNPQVQLVEGELGTMRGQLAKAEASSDGGYMGLGLSSVPGAELDFVRGARELRYQESVYELLLKQYEVARVDEAREAPLVQVLQVAAVAEKPAWPKKIILLPCFAFLGLLAGCGRVAYLRWRGSLNEERAAQIGDLRRAVWQWS